MTLTYEQKCFQWASMQFLYEPLDDDYFKLSEEDQHTHLETYAWEPISHHYGCKIASYIDSLAEHIIQKLYPIKTEEPQ